MKRIPIYDFISGAGLYLSIHGMTIAIEQSYYELYLEKFFPEKGRKRTSRTFHLSAEDIDSIRSKIAYETRCLKTAYEGLSGKAYNVISDCDLLRYDSVNETKEKEAFSLTESLYRIIEFYERFVLFLERMEKGTSRNETLRALTA